jgi:hypothetical protein
VCSNHKEKAISVLAIFRPQWGERLENKQPFAVGGVVLTRQRKNRAYVDNLDGSF